MKKAFTLVELLATISILAIIISIATVSVIKIIDTNRQKLYDIEIKNIIEIAKLYYTNNLEELPDDNNNSCITLNTLISSGYTKEIINPKTNKPFHNLAIKVTNSNGNYVYEIKNTCDIN
ncbi:MAG: prepilin-type N-terminal cleavage/methylation domain-containing protein [Bacilli bacterium]|nr:prepilin-type N-terminal cleavage/methylation domain-containing protein [Bacilli bacterium]